MDKEIEIEAFSFEDTECLTNTLKNLNKLRKNKHFCDVILQIGTHEIHAHRPVLACASPYLFDLFSMEAEGTHEYRFKLNGGFEKDAFERLVDYAYTARLEIPHNQVKVVYMTALRLKMERAARKCGEYLVAHLNPENCIGIRSIPGLCSDQDLCGVIDTYIQREIKNVAQSKELHALPRVQVEVLRNSQGEIDIAHGEHLCNLILDWIRQDFENEDVAVNALTEKVHLLYVNIDHSLHDCNDIQNGDFNDSDIIQDYKKKSKQYGLPPGKNKKKSLIAPIPAKPRQLLYSRSTSDSSICSEGGQDSQWKMIACMPTGENSLVAVVVINSRLCMLSAKQRLNHPSGRSPPPPSSVLPAKDIEEYHLLPAMNSARCAVGTAELNGKLLVCGGYDRGECLKTVQMYNPMSNCWQVLEAMRHSRGRFDITVLGTKVFAVGGCDGTNELASVECYDTDTQKWKMLPPLPMARSNAGVCSLDGKVYCIGGWSGNVGTKRCDVYDPASGTWLEIAPLSFGRSQAGVCATNDNVYAVGGCDLWNCLNSVEKYDPQTNSWIFLKPTSTARRGCGAAVYNGKIYVVGGSDGSRSLCSVEVYDPETNTWSVGPNLTSCRANVGVAVVANRLYAVGGFTGKTFLNTIEYLDPQLNEWTTFTVNNQASKYIERNGHS